ncbi:amino acid racemase [Polaribacter batillariae]|uniref:Amino acid racemase n=1 Tax=Polaribacter batillariae TaxID=2808900 RepID=A0ABX7SV15_9FLAO|nr:amino acid racemase [Polaribacter batillariae]QTD38075.1 amino acid racemase [Polaribacter batillariae]
MTKTIGICAHSYEGGALSFLAACRQGAKLMGQHMHPNIILSAIPMGLSMKGWESGNHDEVAKHLKAGIHQISKSGADFFICPDNTAHIVLENIIEEVPIPGLHIANVVCEEIKKNNWKKVGLLGTKWTMDGKVYPNILNANNLSVLTPIEAVKKKINDAIFDELCQGVFKRETTELFIKAINGLKQDGAECVVLGCTEIPLIINSNNSPLPILDSTRLLSKYAVKLALLNKEIPIKGWINATNKELF